MRLIQPQIRGVMMDQCPRLRAFSVQVVRIKSGDYPPFNLGKRNLGPALLNAVLHSPSPSLYLVEADIQSLNGFGMDCHYRNPGRKETAGENGNIIMGESTNIRKMSQFNAIQQYLIHHFLYLRAWSSS